jgi:hypothetical protein
MKFSMGTYMNGFAMLCSPQIVFPTLSATSIQDLSYMKECA